MTDFDKAPDLLNQFKGDAYLFGNGVLDKIGHVVAKAGTKAVLVRDTFGKSDEFVKTISESPMSLSKMILMLLSALATVSGDLSLIKNV